MRSAIKLMCSLALAVGLGVNATQMRKQKPRRAPAKVNTTKPPKPTKAPASAEKGARPKAEEVKPNEAP